MLNKEEVEKVLEEQVRPHLVADGGNIELVSVEGNVVKVKLQGACGACPMAQMTYNQGLKWHSSKPSRKARQVRLVREKEFRIFNQPGASSSGLNELSILSHCERSEAISN